MTHRDHHTGHQPHRGIGHHGALGRSGEPPDHLDDLRALLPAELNASKATDADVARLWVAWEAARRGHHPEYLVEAFAVSPELAEKLHDLAITSEPARDAPPRLAE